MKIINKLIKDCCTGPDGKTYDPARMLWIFGVIAFICFTAYEVFKSNDFNMVNFSIAYSSLLVAGGIGVKVKESTEPPAAIVPTIVTK